MIIVNINDIIDILNFLSYVFKSLGFVYLKDNNCIYNISLFIEIFPENSSIQRPLYSFINFYLFNIQIPKDFLLLCIDYQMIIFNHHNKINNII